MMRTNPLLAHEFIFDGKSDFFQVRGYLGEMLFTITACGQLIRPAEMASAGRSTTS
jgi:hypothetical protein